MLFAILATVILGAHPASAWTAVMTLDPAGKYNVSWLTGANNITFQVSVATTGWVGLGLSPKGSMAGADIIVAWVAANGSAYLEDRHAEMNGLPSKDASQDVHLINATQTNGITTVIFTRLLNTCDEPNDLPIDESTVRLVYAFGNADPTNNLLGWSDQHSASNRGAKSVYLLYTPIQQTVSANDTETFEFKTLYEIPNSSTTYYCSFHAAPNVTSKRHVISFEPIIQAGNEALVHHILVYACPALTKVTFDSSPVKDHVCFTPIAPEFANDCQAVNFAWAVGGNPVHLPEHVGLPIGDQLAPAYYMLQVHYSNPTGLSGRNDSSGMRIYHTAKLRDHDAAMLQTGSVSGIFVPPQADKFQVYGYCTGDCTQQWIPKTGVNVFGYFLHAHLLGAGIKVAWYRAGVELAPLADDSEYDFNYQEMRVFNEERTLVQGDTLRISCTMDAANRDVITYGGIATTDEMCLAYLLYYPRQNISDCMSMGSYLYDSNSPLWIQLGISPVANRFGFVDYEKYLEKVAWDDGKIVDAEQGYKDTAAMSICYLSGGIAYQSNFRPFALKSVTPYNVKDICSNKTDDSPGEGYSVRYYLAFLIVNLMITKVVDLRH